MGRSESLLDQTSLNQSSVIANCRMNRERQLAGPNGYAREIGINPLNRLVELAGSGGDVRWLDLCCGSGRALNEAARALTSKGLAERIRIIGVDLAGCFLPVDADLACVTLHECGIEDWQFTGPYELVTCVHGLHYVGDKLDAIRRAVASLTTDGEFLANLDLANLRHADGRPMARVAARWLRASGIDYDARRRVIRCRGPKSLPVAFAFIGASDNAGPNYTGQNAVDSYYRSAG